jgi:hypothetical protein
MVRAVLAVVDQSVVGVFFGIDVLNIDGLVQLLLHQMGALLFVKHSALDLKVLRWQHQEHESTGQDCNSLYVEGPVPGTIDGHNGSKGVAQYNAERRSQDEEGHPG